MLVEWLERVKVELLIVGVPTRPDITSKPIDASLMPLCSAANLLSSPANWPKTKRCCQLVQLSPHSVPLALCLRIQMPPEHCAINFC
jgi:hypothetical protein